MEIAFFSVILAVLLFGFFALWNTSRKKSGPNETDQVFVLLQNQLHELQRTLDLKLGESSKVLRDQFGESAKLIKEITQELTKVNEGQKQVISLQDQLKNLQDILKNPKQRGVLGEYYLKTVLENVLPPGSYQMQYPFKDGTIVDAVVITKEGVVPIDSKFSLENYNRLLEAHTQEERDRYESAFVQDLKMRIEETSKYVKPEENTLNFAFMFIPSEAVYYDLLINKVGALKANSVSLIEHAWKKQVIVVSPTTFLAYLQTVLQGLRALKVEESTKEIKKRVYDLGRHLGGYESYMQKLGGNLGTTVKSYNQAYKELAKIDKDVLKISGEAIGTEPLAIEEPENDA